MQVFYSLPAVLTLSYALSSAPYESPLWQKLSLADFLFCVVFAGFQLRRLSSLEIGFTTEPGRELMGTTLTTLWILTLFLHSVRLVGSTAIAANLVTIALLSVYYLYLVMLTDLELQDHCTGAFTTSH
jgi:hypothetical protein